MCKVLTFVERHNFGTIGKIRKRVKLIDFNLKFQLFLAKKWVKVICFTKLERKCSIINNERPEPETVFVPARETTRVGSWKMGKCGTTVIYTCECELKR